MHTHNATSRPSNQTNGIHMAENTAYEGEIGMSIQSNQDSIDYMTVNRGYLRHIPPESNATNRNAGHGRLSPTVTSEL